MLKKFSVKNFKNFKEELILDFSKIRDYEFNKSLIKNNLINKSLIYGPNNSGKSNLGAAIMDITMHLTDNKGNENKLYNYYVNGDNANKNVKFKYEFSFNNKDVVYIYEKSPKMKLVKEELRENDTLLFKYDYKTNDFINNIVEAKTIDISKRNNSDMSVLKFIYTNTLYWEEDSAVSLLMNFVKNMLRFRSLRQNEFIGIMQNGENLNDFIINEHLLKEFEQFLRECGQDYKLCELIEGGKKIVGVKYESSEASFADVASTGTLSLWLFFYWMNRTKDISFVFLDEFDAFYHYELSTYILKYINSRNDFQSILTTHNTFLMSNELMRPDCYMILKNNKITNIADRTNKTIRQAHNLEKMMLGGEFE